MFGSRDGYVYCLNAKSGTLRWRFLAAEQDKRLFNFEQLESVWPVFGSVLVLDRQVCFTAGRSLFLDGGITFYKLDLATGEILAQQRWDHRGPSGENYHAMVDHLSMPAANNDVLSSNGKHIFMSSQVVTMDGKHGSLLKIIDKTNGEEIDSVELAFMPTFDGMITAEGKIFMTTSDGQVVCLDCQTQH